MDLPNLFLNTPKAVKRRSKLRVWGDAIDRKSFEGRSSEDLTLPPLPPIRKSSYDGRISAIPSFESTDSFYQPLRISIELKIERFNNEVSYEN